MNAEAVIPVVSALSAVSEGQAGIESLLAARSRQVSLASRAAPIRAPAATLSSTTHAANFATFASPTRIGLPTGSPVSGVAGLTSSVFGGSRPLLGSPLASTSAIGLASTSRSIGALAAPAPEEQHPAVVAVAARQLPGNVKLAAKALVNQLLAGAGAAPVSDSLPHVPALGAPSVLSYLYLDSSLTHEILLANAAGDEGDSSAPPITSLLHFRLSWPGLKYPLHLHVKTIGRAGTRCGLSTGALLEAACADLAYLCEQLDAGDFNNEEAQEALAELLAPPLRYRIMADGALLGMDDDEFLSGQGTMSTSPLQVVFLPPPAAALA